MNPNSHHASLHLHLNTRKKRKMQFLKMFLRWVFNVDFSPFVRRLWVCRFALRETGYTPVQTFSAFFYSNTTVFSKNKKGGNKKKHQHCVGVESLWPRPHGHPNRKKVSRLRLSQDSRLDLQLLKTI